MLTFSQLLFWFPALLLFVIFIYILGHFATAICKVRFQKLEDDLLAKLLTGTFLIITLFSLFKSHGITFNIIFVVLFGLIFRHYYQSENFKNKKINLYLFDFQTVKSYHVFIYLFIFGIIFVLRCVWLMDENTGFLFSTLDNPDNEYYAQIGDFLKLTGQENRYTTLNLWDKEAHGISPYHYFELWFIAILGTIFPLPTMYIFMVFVFSYFLFILFLGYESLLSSMLKKHNWYHSILSFVFLFSSIIYLHFFLDYTSPMVSTYHFVYGDHSIPFMNIKALIPEILCVTFLILLIKKKHQIAILFILAFPVISFLAAPGIFGGIFLVLILNLKYNFLKVKTKELLVVTCFIAVFLIVFWKLNTPALTSLESNMATSLFFTYKETSFGGFLWESWKALAHIPFIYLPFSLILPVLLIFYRHQYTRLEFVRIALPNILIFMVAWAISRINPYYDWGQFFTVVSYAMGKICFTVILWAIAEKWTQKQLKYYIPILLCFGVLFFRVTRNCQLKIKPQIHNITYSKSYLKQMDSLLQTIENEQVFIGGTIANKKYFAKQEKATYMGYTEVRHIGYMKPNTQTIHLSLYNFLENDLPRDKQVIRDLNPVILYFKKHPEITNLDSGLISFIQERNLKYIIVKPDANHPEILNKLIKTKMIDSKSGEQFWLLK